MRISAVLHASLMMPILSSQEDHLTRFPRRAFGAFGAFGAKVLPEKSVAVRSKAAFGQLVISDICPWLCLDSTVLHYKFHHLCLFCF